MAKPLSSETWILLIVFLSLVVAASFLIASKTENKFKDNAKWAGTFVVMASLFSLQLILLIFDWLQIKPKSVVIWIVVIILVIITGVVVMTVVVKKTDLTEPNANLWWVFNAIANILLMISLVLSFLGYMSVFPSSHICIAKQ